MKLIGSFLYFRQLELVNVTWDLGVYSVTGVPQVSEIIPTARRVRVMSEESTLRSTAKQVAHVRRMWKVKDVIAASQATLL